MNTNSAKVQSGSVSTEGDDLYFEVRGRGQPLLLIPGGGGNASIYSHVAEILSDEFKVISYDRRANSRSTGNNPQNFDLSQQSRDVVAVLEAAGESSAYIFGSSSGAVIALDMAKTQPHAVRAIVAHEPPTVRVHPGARKWQRFFANTYWMAFRFGTLIAFLKFVFGVGLPIWELARASSKSEREQQKARGVQAKAKDDNDFFLEQELLPVTNYMPDIEMIRKNGVRVFLAAGKVSLEKKRFYAQTAPILARLLNCELITFPGHHVSYVDMPAEWSAVLRNIIHQAAGSTR